MHAISALFDVSSVANSCRLVGSLPGLILEIIVPKRVEALTMSWLLLALCQLPLNIIFTVFEWKFPRTIQWSVWDVIATVLTMAADSIICVLLVTGLLR